MWTTEALRGQEVYLDSNVLIYAFEGSHAGLLDGLRAVFSDLRTGATRARTSLLTRAEVLVRPLREQQDDLVRMYRKLLCGTEDIAVQPVDGGIVDCAAELRARHGALRLPDALHIATATLCECDCFLTSDKRLASASSRVQVLLLQEMDQR